MPISEFGIFSAAEGQPRTIRAAETLSARLAIFSNSGTFQGKRERRDAT